MQEAAYIERQQFEARVSTVRDILQRSALIHLDRHECNEIATLLEHLAAAVPSDMSKQLEREAKQMRGAVDTFIFQETVYNFLHAPWR